MDDPGFLEIGTEVSAKFKGAYCEAKIDQIEKNVTVKVQLKESPFNTIDVSYEALPNSKFALNELTDVVIEGKFVRCKIVFMKDQSKYHVVFNDGDEKDLRRSQIVLKGKKHFDADGNLDSMPLTNPEAFSTPVVRGAAKRGAQKIRSINQASGSRARRIVEASETELIDDLEQSSPRKKRKAANAAEAAIGELIQVPDTNSEESATDSSEERGKATVRRRQREENAGPSTSAKDSSDDDKDDDEEDDDRGETSKRSGNSPLVNGSSAAKSEKDREKLIKKQEKEARKRLKDEGREQDRFQKLLEKHERNRRKVEEKARGKDLKRKEKLFKKLAEQKEELHEKSMAQILTRSSQKHTSKLNAVLIRNKKKRRKRYREQAYRLRNFKLYHDWRRYALLMGMNDFSKHQKRWWRVSEEYVRRTRRTRLLLQKPKRMNLIRKWLEGMEKTRRLTFVVIHESHGQARRLLKFVERASEKKSFTERCKVSYEEMDSPTATSHFNQQEWYIAVLFPQVFSDPNGGQCSQRVVRHLGTGELLKVWEDDLIPFEWLPEYSTHFEDITEKRPEDRRYNFKLSWKFASDYVQKNLNMLALRYLLRWNWKLSSDYFQLNEQSARQTSVPSPTKRNEESDDDNEAEESDYDSDASIKNADSEEKNVFVAKLFHFHDARKSRLSENPKIQGVDVDLHYFFEVARKMGGPKKVMALNPWTELGRKLVPTVSDPEEELKEMFQTYLQPYFQLNAKLYWPMENLAPRSERKVVQPGQYSESRRRKVKTSEEVAGEDNQTPSSKSGGRGGGKVGRRRKVSISDSVSESGVKQRISSSVRGSRETTFSPAPGPSHVFLPSDESDVDDDDDASSSLFSGDSERRGSVIGKPGRKKGSKNSKRGRRSMSSRNDETPGPVKKGRPKKNVGAASTQKVEVKKERKSSGEEKFTRATLLSQICAGQKLRAYYRKQWYSALAVEDSDDFSDEIMKAMLKNQENYPYRDRLSVQTEDELRDIFKRMRTKTHYKGWNSRYDEFNPYSSLKVTIEDQANARKRFRRMPHGDELYPETLALVDALNISEYEEEGAEEKSRTAAYSAKEFQKLAEIALRYPSPTPEVKRQEANEESDNESAGVPQKRDDEKVVANNEDDTKEEEETEDRKEEIPEAVHIEKEEEEEARKKVVEASPKSVETSVDSDSENEEDENEKSDRKTSVESIEQKSPSRELEDGLEGDLESESDEPEYPPIPMSPELPAMKSPVVQNVPSVDRMSSGTSSYPVLSRQASTTSVSSSMPIFSPTNSLAHSGPLTLEEVPPPTLATQSFTQKPNEQSVDSEDSRKRCSSTDGRQNVEPMIKRIRRISEAEPVLIDSPKRIVPSPLVQQFSSGALTLDIPPPSETSGPIEPLSIKKGGRKKTVIAASPPVISSGPLIISPTPFKGRPPGSSPLGRPKKKFSETSAASLSSSRKTLDNDDDARVNQESESIQSDSTAMTGSIGSRKESQDSRIAMSGNSTPMTIDEKDDDVADQFDASLDPQIVPRGTLSARGGKRKRGGRFGGSYSVKPVKPARKTKEREEDGDDKDDEDSEAQTSTPTHSTRTDSFQTQKNRMAKLMEQEGTKEHFHLLEDLPDFNLILVETPKEDVNMVLEERSNELREQYALAKFDLSQLEKRYRQQVQNEAKRNAASSSASSTPSQSTS